MTYDKINLIQNQYFYKIVKVIKYGYLYLIVGAVTTHQIESV
ncbi:hypothetical protein NIES2107_04630 [Nostoc carneum NIES-2107]|nr:hypothetical protein NIES2107_04630 [Nostoc carneum NIES-2107]